MNQGLFAATSGGLLESRRLQVVANNMANVSTVGYKAERLVSRQQEFSDTLASEMEKTPWRAEFDQARVPGVVSIASKTDFTPGPVSYTGNPLNVAISEANTFFVIASPEGELYTRAGNFTTDQNGNLVTQDGLAVLGEGGPLTINEGPARITANGSLIAGEQVVGQLRTVRIDALEGLERREGTRFALVDGGAPVAVPAQVVPQSVEMPNVDVVEAMVEMIAAQRSFEAYTKTVQTMDELNERSLRTARTSG